MNSMHVLGHMSEAYGYKSNDAVAKESLGAVLSCVAREAKHSEVENTGKRLAFLRKECTSW